MKSNVSRNYKGEPQKKTLVVKEDDMKRLIDTEFKERWKAESERLYEEAKKDCSAQILAVFFTVMNKRHGWGKKRLLDLKSDVESFFKLMQSGDLFYTKSFTPVDCIGYIKEEFDIDLDNGEVFE